MILAFRPGTGPPNGFIYAGGWQLRVNLGRHESADDNLVARRLADFVIESQRRFPGLAITVENHWGISTDIDRHLKVVRHAAQRLPSGLRACVGCCFDPHNMPYDVASEQEIKRWWQELASEANHYHFKTTAFDEEGSDMALPQARLMAPLADVGNQGDAAIEYQGEGDAVEAVRLSRELFERLLAEKGR